ncbi:MAG: helix-turn-helix transcriptional regulator [bacterium]
MVLFRQIIFLPFFFICFLNHITAAPLFYSSFEDGVTCLAEDCKAGRKIITLIWNDNLEEWPDSGFGVIGYDTQSAKEFFRYKRRKDNLLYLSEPLKRFHYYGEDVRTSGFSGWSNNLSVYPDTGDGAMFGQFGARIYVERGKPAELQKQIPIKKVLYVNFYFKTSKDLLKKINNKEHFGFMVMQPFEIWLGLIKDRPDDSCCFYVSQKKSRLRSRPVHADTAYCLEIRYGFKENNKIICDFWVNGRYIGKISDMTYLSNLESVEKIRMHLGNPNKRGKPGFICFDEITVSNKYIGVRPARPNAVAQNKTQNKIQLVCSPFNSIDTMHKHHISHWQVGRNSNFNIPVFNSGATMKHLTSIILPEYLDISGKLLWRVRHRDSAGLWSQWSVPAVLNTAIPPAPQKWVINDIIITEPGTMESVDNIKKSKWYNFKLMLGKGDIWENISYMDLWMEYADDAEISPDNRKSILYNPRRNYWISLSLGDSSLWGKTIEGSANTSNITGTSGSFWQDSLYHYKWDKKQGCVKVRLRLLEKSRSGLWTLKAFFTKRDGYSSPVFSKPIIVLHPAATVQKPRLSCLIFIISFLILIFILVIVIMRRFKQKKSKKDSVQAQSRQQVLLDKACNFINDNFQDFKLNRIMIARHLGISERYLGQLFKELKNTSANQFVNDFRIERSKKLLLDTNIKIVDIAMQVGFRDTNNFINVFKKSEKLTPGQFRVKFHKTG